MKPKYLATVCAVTFGAAGITFGSGAFAQSPSDMKAQIEELQRQLQVLKERLDKQEAQQAQKPAPSRAAAGGTEHGFLERKEGDGITFYTRGGEVSVYGNLDLSVDSTTKGISGMTAPVDPGFGAPGAVFSTIGNGGWMSAISSNLSYVGVRGFQSLGDMPMNFVYQLETQIDVSATSGTGISNSRP